MRDAGVERRHRVAGLLIGHGSVSLGTTVIHACLTLPACLDGVNRWPAGHTLDVPAVSIPAEQAAVHFARFPFITMDLTMPSTETRELLGWDPVHPALIADIDQGHYFTD